jgi:hypothetical protein
MRYLGYVDSELVAVVSTDSRRRWQIIWPRRQWCRERILNPEAAKSWVGQLFHGKTVLWVRDRGNKIRIDGEK